MFVELSYRLEEGAGPGVVLNLPPFTITWRSKFGDGQKKSNQSSLIQVFSHHGTHIDTPLHVYAGGPAVSAYDLSDFILEHPVLINCPKEDRMKIETADLIPFAGRLRDGDALLVYTGFSRYREVDPERFVLNSPSFSLESLNYLTENFPNIRCLGMDLMGIENIPEGREKGWPAHKAFLKENEKRYLIEDLNLKPVLDKEIHRLMVLPLHMQTEASPVIVIAETED